MQTSLNSSFTNLSHKLRLVFSNSHLQSALASERFVILQQNGMDMSTRNLEKTNKESQVTSMESRYGGVFKHKIAQINPSKHVRPLLVSKIPKTNASNSDEAKRVGKIKSLTGTCTNNSRHDAKATHTLS